MRHRPERGRLIERVAEHIAADEVGRALHERVVAAFVHVDSLDAAAALAGIEEGAVDEILDRVRHVGVGPHIGGILAAELEPECREGPGGSALDRAARRQPSR